MVGARERILRWIPAILVGVLPALALAVGVARFILNHFYGGPPILLDSGLLSKIVYRDGLTLSLPHIAVDYADSFYDVHVSPLLSAFSALSYAAPVGRVVWFAIVLGVLYVPVGLAVQAVASRLSPATALRRVPITLLAAFAFSFSGLVLWTIDYPHFETATAGLTCLLLATLVTGRTRLAWTCLILAACVKQDAGLHIATALAGLWLVRGRLEIAPTRRKIAVMAAAAIGLTIAAIVVQKLVFHPIGRFQQAYIGQPAYAHVTAQLLRDRLRFLADYGGLLYLPVLASCALAIARRDARYLVGWLTVVPWFVVNLLAVDGAKATLLGYGMAPFLVGVFWIYLYGAHIAPVGRRLRPAVLEGVFAVVCLTSTYGSISQDSEYLTETRAMAFIHYDERAPVDDFVSSLRAHRAELGRLRVDYAIAALGIEWLDLDNAWVRGGELDALAFHRRGIGVEGRVADILMNELEACTFGSDSKLALCTRDGAPAAWRGGPRTQTLPSIAAFSRIPDGMPGIALAPDRVTLTYGYELRGLLGQLPVGRYEWILDVAPVASACSVHIVAGEKLLAAATVTLGATQVVVPFAVTVADSVAYHHEGLTAPGTLTITHWKLRKLP